MAIKYHPDKIREIKPLKINLRKPLKLTRYLATKPSVLTTIVSDTKVPMPVVEPTVEA